MVIGRFVMHLRPRQFHLSLGPLEVTRVGSVGFIRLGRFAAVWAGRRFRGTASFTFHQGGYVEGPLPTVVAGQVHPAEFRVNAQSFERNRALLDRINSAPSRKLGD